MALYIPHSIFHLAWLLYVRPETFEPYYVYISSNYGNISKKFNTWFHFSHILLMPLTTHITVKYSSNKEIHQLILLTYYSHHNYQFLVESSSLIT
jgi:hypothetical protein